MSIINHEQQKYAVIHDFVLSHEWITVIIQLRVI